MKVLIIVESPSKIKTIQKFLNKDYSLKASFGHCVDLPQKGLGIDIENNFKATYVPIPNKKDAITEIRKAASSVDIVYLASDPDREGEAIAFHLSNLIGSRCPQVKRITFNAITKQAITEALKNPRDINLALVAAQSARRLLDRLVGFKISPTLWYTIEKGTSAGRVQTAGLRLIVERQREIDNFKPEEYWSITCEVSTAKNEIFQAKYFTYKGKKTKISDKATADKLVDYIKKQNLIVSKLEQKNKNKNPLPPFTTSTLQQAAAHKLGYSSEKTMQIAQHLYEGTTIDGEQVGLITYMRTDSVRTAPEAITAIRDIIKTNYGDKYLPASANIYKSKKDNIQDAHEAIRPAHLEMTPDDVKKKVPNEQARLYKLIYDRFVASQMAAAKLKVTTVDVDAGDVGLRTNGSIIEFDGFLKVYQDDKKEEDEEGGILPVLKEKDPLTLKSINSKQHFTQPPPAFNDASFVKTLEEKGIGRPSTYAAIIKTLQDRNYIQKDGKKFVPTELGYKVCDFLVDHFPDLFNTTFTAEMEEKLDEIEEGKLTEIQVLKDFYEKMTESLKHAKSSVKDTRITEYKCPKCGRPLVLRISKHGRFYGCSGYEENKACIHIMSIGPDGQPIENIKKNSQLETNGKCPKCKKGDKVKRKGKFGEFWGCSTYPHCKFTEKM